MARYGFNFQWMYSWREGVKPEPADVRALDFVAHFGFNFVRIPTDYHYWTRNFDYQSPDERVFEVIDSYLRACRERGIHLSLNLHRAPGYCINGWEQERDNLWKDEAAQAGFEFLWRSFAARYRGVPSSELSFDLVNEPPDMGRRGFTRAAHERVIRRVVAAIREVDPNREIVIDGLAGGNLAMPEFADLGVIQSGRGYQPMPVSHYGAGWWEGCAGLPEPVYPGTKWEGRAWNRETLRDFYGPWLDLQEVGVAVHIGEFGCYDKTPNDLALRWFEDLLALFKEFGWGFALWGFEGAFGICSHERPGVRYESIRGYQVDRRLLDLLLDARV